MAKVVLALAILTTAQALTLSGDKAAPYFVDKDHVVENVQHGSKPGSAVVKDWRRAPLFGGGQEWRGELGSQLLVGLRAGAVMNFCKSFISVGNYTWCKQALPTEGTGSSQKVYEEHEYVLPKSMEEKDADDKPDSLLGLSFGVSQPDTWSELLSNKYSVKTKLFDCNFEVPSDMHGQHSKEKPCDAQQCYSTEYEVAKVCLADSNSTGTKESFTAKNGMTYQPLSAALEGRERLSTFVKLDVDGAEWATLEWLLGHDDEIKKIRTLDVHMNLVKDATPDETLTSSEESMKHHVEIVKNLAKKFALVGSTIEGSSFSFSLDLESTGRAAIKEPLIHTQGGLPLEELTASYMNYALL